MKFKHIYLLALLIAGTTLNTTAQSTSGTINLQFIDTPVFNSTLKLASGRSISTPNYISFYDGFETEDVKYTELKAKNVATYTTQANQVILRRYLGYFEFQDFLVQPGDSLMISYNTKKPISVKHSTIKYAPQDFNVENLLHKKHPNPYTIIGQLADTRRLAAKTFFDDPKKIAAQQKRSMIEKGKANAALEVEVTQALLPAILVLQKNAQQLFDSLYNEKQISGSIYEFYTHKYATMLLSTEIMAGSKDSTVAADQLNMFFAKRSNIDIYLNQSLESFVKKAYEANVKWTLSDQYSLRDPRETYKLARQSKLLVPQLKERLLFMNLAAISNFFPLDIDEYLKLFKNDVSDTALLQAAEDRFLKDNLTIASPSGLALLTMNQSQTNIEALLEKNKGKVLYIDLWASWCAPCIQEMKHSLSLKQKYAGQNVEVVFISLDDNFPKWEKAAIRQGLKGLESSFKALKPEEADFIKKIKLQSIPRYLLIDKAGKITNADAPRPSDPTIAKLIDGLLTK